MDLDFNSLEEKLGSFLHFFSHTAKLEAESKKLDKQIKELELEKSVKEKREKLKKLQQEVKG